MGKLRGPVKMMKPIAGARDTRRLQGGVRTTKYAMLALEHKKREEQEKLEIEKATTTVVEPRSMFANSNLAIKPPYHGITSLLLAKCNLYVTDCIIGELEKLGQKANLAIKLARDPRVKKLTCLHKGIYADDCICKRVTNDRIYLVATNDKDLRRRLRKIKGVPCVYVMRYQFHVENMPNFVPSVRIDNKKV